MPTADPFRRRRARDRRPGARLQLHGRGLRGARCRHRGRPDRQERCPGTPGDRSPAEEIELAADPQRRVVPDQRITGRDARRPVSADRREPGLRTSEPDRSTGGLDRRVDADVAIFDTGIDPTHTDLVVAGGYNCTSSNRASWMDQHGHGTHVAGTVGARDDADGVVGVAPGVRLWAVRILDASGEGHLSWWLCGLDWIAAQNDPLDPTRPLIEAVNMSVTRWGVDDGKCGTVNNDLLHQAVCRVVARGITVVAAAANDSGSAAKRVPAAYNEVITVSALADTDGRPAASGGKVCWSWGGYDVDDTFADFSNYGSDVDIIAPGKCILSTKRGQTYGYSSGTSMAAPLVTGAAALYKATRPNAPPSEVKMGAPVPREPGLEDGHRPRRAARGPARRVADRAARRLHAGSRPAVGELHRRRGRGQLDLPSHGRRGRASSSRSPSSLPSSRRRWPRRLPGPPRLRDGRGTGLAITVPPSTPAGVYEVVVRAAYRTTRIHESALR